jgi:hypothetical protein
MRYRLLSLVMVIIIAFGITGCGGGGGSTSADPLETDSLVFGYKEDVEGTNWTTAMNVDRHETVILTAKVKNASGEPVINRRVSFDFAANGSGAVLSAYSGYTNSAGEASIIYTAGMADGFDIVKAKISNGSSMFANIAVADPLGTDSLNLASSATQVNYRGTVTLTATVIDESGDGVVGREVLFEFVSNQSGASLSSNIVKTGYGGRATVVYTAGMADGFDVVRASISNGSSMIANITVASAAGGGDGTGGDEGGGGVYTVSIGASTASVTAGQVSIITATVTSDSEPANGVTVSFTLPVNSSGATLTPITATTDGSGKAVVIYQPGTTNPTLTVQDTVRAAVGSATSATVITRVGSAVSAYGITVTANPEYPPNSLETKGSNSVITAKVINSAGDLISGITVNFAVSGAGAGGTLSVASATTDASGNAVTIFTGDGVSATGATSVVTASITISGNTYNDAVMILYP